MSKCKDCKFLSADSTSLDYPWIWCSKDKWSGVDSTDCLEVDIKCEEYDERRD